MKHRQQRRLEWTLLVFLWTSGVACIGWATLGPVPLPSSQTSSGALPRPQVTPTASPSSDTTGELEWNQRLSERRLQGWAIASAPQGLDSSTATPIYSSAAEPLAGLVLTGTIVEPGKSFAMFSDRSGATDLKPVGGLLRLEPAGIRIDSIVGRRVVVSFEGLTHELELPHTATSLVDPPPAEVTPLEAELDWLNGSEPDNSPSMSTQHPTDTPMIGSQMGVGP